MAYPINPPAIPYFRRVDAKTMICHEHHVEGCIVCMTDDFHDWRDRQRELPYYGFPIDDAAIWEIKRRYHAGESIRSITHNFRGTGINRTVVRYHIRNA